ncbi:MAG TPA: hypothetical protein VHF91_06615, partial [Acidimicrobiales bacterium]|nr:hypothetical protein [Acidimicrobiales bacterium]
MFWDLDPQVRNPHGGRVQGTGLLADDGQLEVGVKGVVGADLGPEPVLERGYKIRLPLDLMLVASANPEDYTNRGRIITPLKDRFGAQIRTHYPLD